MGCDIHLFAERKINNQWESLNKYTKNPDYGLWEGEPKMYIADEDQFYTGGRNYNLFCALAGVRSFHFTNNPPIISEPKGFPDDACQEIKHERARYGSDGHSDSWLTLKEMEQWEGWKAYTPTTDAFLDEVLPKMQLSTISAEEVRIVFWFDN